VERTGAAGLAAYLRLLQEDPAELGALVEALTVKVSSFFRDPLAFEHLAELVLPELLARKAAARDPSLRLWSAGCATGEEPYSLAILVHEALRREPSPPAVTILATDLDERALARARAGRYPASALANVRHGLVAAAFEPDGDGFRVADHLARAVTFAVHDLLDPRAGAPAESVFGSFDLVLCRNVLIYFEPAWQEFACERLYRSLAPGGHLLLGRTESLPGPWAGRFRRAPGLRALHRKPARAPAGEDPR
jgi:chemotaxis methyl-accepting protein methylase